MSTIRTKEDIFDVAIPQVPVTEQRKPFFQKEDDVVLKQAGTPRANIAASVEAPHGTLKGQYAHYHQNKTVLQQHIVFFDNDNDGIIWPLDTFYGFRRLGYNLFLSILATVIINGNFSYPTVSGYLPDPFFRIYIERIHKDKHGSDSGTYDNEGRFVPQKFEDIFAKYASGDKKGITVPEILQYFKGQFVVADPFGWFAALFEWLATYILLWPADGRMMKEDIRRVYDGSLFYEIANRRAKANQ